MRIKSLSKSILIYGGGNLLYSMLQLITMPLIVKSLSLPDIASVNVFMSSIVLFSSIITLGMDSASTHLVRNENETTRKIIFSNCFYVVFTAAIVVLPITGFFINHISQQSNNHILLFLCLWILSVAINQFNLNWLKYSFNQNAFLLIILLQSLTYLLSILILYHRGSISIVNFVLVMMVSNLLPGLLGLIINRRMLAAKVNIVLMLNSAKYGIPFMLMTFGFNFIFTSDRFFLFGNISIEDLAIYTQIFRIASIFSIVVSSFNFAFTPYALSILEHEGSNIELSKIRSNYIFILTFMGLLFIALSKILIIFLAGEIFLAGVKLIPFFVFAYIVYGLYSFSQLGIIKSKKSHYSIYVLLAGVIANICLNFFLIRVIDIYGAALSFLVSILLMNLVAVIVTKKQMVISKYNNLDITVGLTFMLFSSLLSFYCVSPLIYIDALIKALGVFVLYLMYFSVIYFITPEVKVLS